MDIGITVGRKAVSHRERQSESGNDFDTTKADQNRREDTGMLS
jgi:hypothetical protein